MSIRKKSIEELELMSYTDIAYEIIKEDKKQYNTPNLFKEICNLLDLHEKEFEEKIGDFYTALSTDKRFILIEGTNWDLKENHIVQIIVDEGEEDIEEEEVSDEETEDIETEDIIDEDDYSEDSMDDEIEVDDGMNDLTIIEDEETEE